MSLVSHLLVIADIFCAGRGLSRARVSTIVFNDGKRLDRLAQGKGLQINTYERAMLWFAANWPEGADWPSDVPRPDMPTLAPDAPGENDNPAAESLTPEECGA